MDTSKEKIIKCPHCGCEYLPCEIFYPNEFLGKASDIVRDDKGHILYYNNKNMDLEENYICDSCGKEFKVYADVKFTSELPQVTFDDDFVQKLN